MNDVVEMLARRAYSRWSFAHLDVVSVGWDKLDGLTRSRWMAVMWSPNFAEELDLLQRIRWWGWVGRGQIVVMVAFMIMMVSCFGTNLQNVGVGGVLACFVGKACIDRILFGLMTQMLLLRDIDLKAQIRMADTDLA